MKQCTACKEEKPLSEFYVNRSGNQGVFAKCKVCTYKYSREWKVKNRDKNNAHSRKMKAKRKQYYVDLMGGKCADCKQSYPLCVFDFHHTDPDKKDVSIATSLNNSLRYIEKEIDKCVLLCANCHRIRHHAT